MNAANSVYPLTCAQGPFCVKRHERTVNARVEMEHAIAPISQNFERPPFIRSVRAPPVLQDLLAVAEKEISEREPEQTWLEPLNKTTNTSNYKQLLDTLKQHYPGVSTARVHGKYVRLTTCSNSVSDGCSDGMQSTIR